jgi:F0F1-type ATP synthase membrane subunit b/b'
MAEVTELAVAAAGKVSGRTITVEEQRRLAEAVLQEHRSTAAREVVIS